MIAEKPFKVIFPIILFLLLFNNLPAQTHDFEIGDAPLLGLGTLGFAITFPLQEKTPPLTLAEVKEYVLAFEKNPGIINGLDRGTVKQNHLWAHKVSNWTLYASAASPLILISDKDSREESGTVGVMWAETLLITGAITNLVKVGVKRNRPFVYHSEPLPAGYDKYSRQARFSFFSGHTSMSAASTFFAAKVFSDNNPGHDLEPFYWVTAAALPAVTGFLRHKAGKHFFTDVIAGYAIGAMVGILVPELHK